LHKKSELPAIVQQFIVDSNTLDYPVGSIYYSITSENLDGIDAKAVNKHLLSRNRPQRIRILYTDGAGESASHNLEEFFTDVNIQHLQSAVTFERLIKNCLASKRGEYYVKLADEQVQYMSDAKTSMVTDMW
jgi:hypothetical protein